MVHGQKAKELSAETDVEFPKKRGDLTRSKARMAYFNGRMSGMSREAARADALRQ